MIRRIFATLAATVLLLFALAANAADWKPLVSPQELVGLAGDAHIVDIRLVNGPGMYAEGHIEGSMSAPYPLWRGPKHNPGQPLSSAELSLLLRAKGLAPGRPVVIVYEGETTSQFGAAARVYWTLKSAGFTSIAILDGGVREWTDLGLPLTTDAVTPSPSAARITLSDEWTATREEVRAISGGYSDGVLVDARPDAFLIGKRKHPAAKRAGTIPGAEQFEFTQWFDGKSPRFGDGGGILGRFRPPGGQGPIVSFCNTGHWAAINWFMMSEVQGLPGVKLYPESMVGWTGAGEAVTTQ